jgi:hypothetical protein
MEPTTNRRRAPSALLESRQRGSSVERPPAERQIRAARRPALHAILQPRVRTTSSWRFSLQASWQSSSHCSRRWNTWPVPSLTSVRKQRSQFTPATRSCQDPEEQVVVLRWSSGRPGRDDRAALQSSTRRRLRSGCCQDAEGARWWAPSRSRMILQPLMLTGVKASSVQAWVQAWRPCPSWHASLRASLRVSERAS